MGEQSDQVRQQEDAQQRRPARDLWLRVFGVLSAAIVRLLGATWRLQVLGTNLRESSNEAGAGTVQIGALFHECLLPSVHFFRDRGYSVAVSRSTDGDLIDATLRGLGYGSIARGSSSQGGSAALRGLVRQIEAGTTVSVLVDGPRGPARVSKTGIIALACLTDLPIHPVAFSARPALRLKSWDGSLIPLPFARVVCAFGEPFRIEAEADDQQQLSAARELDRRLGALHHETDQVLL